MRSLDITKENLDNQRNAVQEERRLGVDNQPYGKTCESDRRAGLRQLRLRALGHRLDGGPQRRVGGRRRDVLQDLLRAEQRRAGDRRRRRHRRRRWRKIEKYFERDSIAAAAGGGRLDRAAADRRAARDDRGSAGAAAAHRHRATGAAGDAPDDDALDGARAGAGERPQLAAVRGLVRQKQLATADGASIRTSAARGCSRSSATVRAGQVARRCSRRRSTRRSRR